MLVKNDKVIQIILDLTGETSTWVADTITSQVLKILKIDQTHHQRHKRRYYVNQTIKKLFGRGLIEFKLNDHGVRCARLTAKGRAELDRYRVSEVKIKKPRRWDGKYRLVIFDIKEWKRGTRNRIRRWLEHLGFVRLQNSVWVYPYECQEIVILLKSHFKIGREVLYLTVDSIENDKWLREEFNLG